MRQTIAVMLVGLAMALMAPAAGAAETDVRPDYSKQKLTLMFREDLQQQKDETREEILSHLRTSRWGTLLQFLPLLLPIRTWDGPRGGASFNAPVDPMALLGVEPPYHGDLTPEFQAPLGLPASERRYRAQMLRYVRRVNADENVPR